MMPKRISVETRERAVRLVLDHLDEQENAMAACHTVSAQLGFGTKLVMIPLRMVSRERG